MEKRTVNISTGIILKVVIVILGLWFLYLVRDIIALFFVAVIITAAIEPAINWFNSKKIPRPLGVLIIYIIIIFILGLLFSFLIPSITNQFKDFSQNFPAYFEKLDETFSGVEEYMQSRGFEFSSREIIQGASDSLTRSSGNIFSTTIGFFSGFISAIVVLSLTFYMSVKKDGMKKFLASITPDIYEKRAVYLAEKIKNKIGRWVVGQMSIMIMIFTLDFLALSILKVPYALALALIGGALEIIPYIGPIISTILAATVGFLISPMAGILTLVLYTAIQQAENHIITPQVMKKAVGLNPVAVILALLIGVKVAGVLGAILAVPTATAIGVIAEDLIARKDYAKLAKGK